MKAHIDAFPLTNHTRSGISCTTRHALKWVQILFVDGVIRDVPEALLHAAVLVIQLPLPLCQLLPATSQLFQSPHGLHHIHHLTSTSAEDHIHTCTYTVHTCTSYIYTVYVLEHIELGM